MYGETKKLYLIKEILEAEDENVLSAVETILSKGRGQNKKRKSFTEFAGSFTDEEVEFFDKIIEEGCEQINFDDWK